MLTSVLGALLPAWDVHLESKFITAGNYFLCFNTGLLFAAWYALSLMPRKGLAFSMVLSSGIACAAFLLLAFAPLAGASLWRGCGLAVLGFSAGLLNAAVFHAISPLFRHDRAATITLAGTLYGLGCFLTALLVAGTYYVYTVRAILILFAVIPGLFSIVFRRAHFPNAPVRQQIPVRQVLADFKNPGAVLFALTLFLQFGNEWAIAGWLPIFLIRRLGISPEASLFLLSFYWGSLLVGRVAAKAMLKRVHHRWLLPGSLAMALLGCIVLSLTTNRFGASTGVLFIGCGFAPIYPLLVERIGHRFTHYHPGLYNGIFSFAYTGGLMAPFTLGYFTQWWGVGSIMVLPMLGTSMVFVLLALIVLETKWSGDSVRNAGA